MVNSFCRERSSLKFAQPLTLGSVATFPGVYGAGGENAATFRYVLLPAVNGL
jgi:hypothetical protein